MHLRWLRVHFSDCPEDADELTVSRHARAWVWHMFGSVLFPDGTGDTASWMFLPCLEDWDVAGTLSWGSGVLAFLYRQLCQACRRRSPSGNLGGCVYLLQVISFARFHDSNISLFNNLCRSF